MKDIDYQLCLRALLEGLECENIDHFMENATEETSRSLGGAIAEDVRYLHKVLRTVKVLIATIGEK